MCISTPLLSISPPKTNKGQKKKKLEKQDQNIGIGLSPFTEILNTKNTPQKNQTQINLHKNKRTITKRTLIFFFIDTQK